MTVNGSVIKPLRLLALAALASALTACVVAPPPRPAPPPPPPPAAPNITIYAYPQNGQSAEQEDRDRYECSTWATQQTGFNPSASDVPPHERVQVVNGPQVVPGSGTAIGAVTGAVVGSVAAGPRNGGAGFLIGALVGGILGTAAEAQTDAQLHAQAQARADASADAQTRMQAAQLEHKASDYRRAISACLAGRGYTVK